MTCASSRRARLYSPLGEYDNDIEIKKLGRLICTLQKKYKKKEK